MTTTLLQATVSLCAIEPQQIQGTCRLQLNCRAGGQQIINFIAWTFNSYIPQHISLICVKSVTIQNLAFLSYWYRKKRLQMHF